MNTSTFLIGTLTTGAIVWFGLSSLALAAGLPMGG